jgi:hypothetical protein
MRGVPARPLGPVAPYIASVAAAAIPFMASPGTAATIPSIGADTRLYADVAQYDVSPFSFLGYTSYHSASYSADKLARYTWDRSFPELVPDALVIPTDSDIFQSQTYEPFIASEGWREIPAPAGPFMVESEEAPPVHFDAYDIATIALYEQE